MKFDNSIAGQQTVNYQLSESLYTPATSFLTWWSVAVVLCSRAVGNGCHDGYGIVDIKLFCEYCYYIIVPLDPEVLNKYSTTHFTTCVAGSSE